MRLTVGDLVTRKSYDHDLLFNISKITENKNEAILHGKDVRLEADASLEDLSVVSKTELKRRFKKQQEQEEFSFRLFRQDYQLMKEKNEYILTKGYREAIDFFRLPVKVLHIDGDASYLKKCIQLYQRLQLQVHGVHLEEKDMPHKVKEYVKKVQPELVVITGHDAFSENKGTRKDLQAYRNSAYFSQTVREIRSMIPNVDQLIIFAGACQSHFESLIRAGANFASSPKRINIHALDPVYIAAKVAYTSFMEKVSVSDVIRNTLTGEKGIGGIETKGLHRIGIPYIEEKQ